MIVRTGAVALLVTLGACATQPPFVHTKVGTAEGELFTDSAACRTLARNGGVSVAPGAPNPALPSQAGAGFGAGLAQGMAQARAEMAGYEACMGERGYLKTVLSPEELKAFKALRTDAERKNWMTRFAGQDYSARAAPAAPAKPCVSNALRKCAS
jgi:hypothetical protein